MSTPFVTCIAAKGDPKCRRRVGIGRDLEYVYRVLGRNPIPPAPPSSLPRLAAYVLAFELLLFPLDPLILSLLLLPEFRHKHDKCEQHEHDMPVIFHLNQSVWFYTATAL